jgi:serine/threonine-protein kinase
MECYINFMPLPAGTFLGPYEVQSFLASGGMGEVYRGRDTRLFREVALKILPKSYATDADRLRRFEQEARAVSALNHPNILVIYDIGTQDGLPYLVTEILDGETLRSLQQQRALSVGTAVNYAVQIASGIAAAHEKMIVHRDLKPENIFITRSGVIKILDFGLAKLTQRSDQGSGSHLSTSPKTSPGAILGTFGYMSPEQTRGQELDPRSDIFSFGAILYEMISGARAFPGNSSAEVISAILRDHPDTSEISRKVSPELMRLLLHCLEKDPLERFQSSRDLSFSLRVIEANLYSSSGVQKTGDLLARVEKQKQASIAVLPFADMSPQKDQEHFCDGITEELISALTKLQGVRVASRTSAFQFKSHQGDIRKIGEQLNVNTILDGSVRKSGNRVRITAELISVSDGYHLWSEKYDRELEDIFDIQEEIARMIVDTLKIRLVGKPSEALVQHYTRDMEAYNFYLQGRHYWTQRTKDGMQKAIEYFQLAIEKDPNYALAYSGLADSNSILGFYAFSPPDEAHIAAKTAAHRALEIDPLLAEGHSSLGAAIAYFQFDWIEAEKLFRKATELNPRYGLGHCWYSGFLSIFGDFENAAAQIKLAQEIDPLSPLFSSFVAFNFYNQRQYDQAIYHCQKALEIDPNFALALWYSGLSHMKKKMHEQSIEILERVVSVSHRATYFVSYLALAYGEAGNMEEAQKLLAELIERSKNEYVAPEHLARIYMALKQTDRVFEEFDRAAAAKNVLLYLRSSPEFDSIRPDPRFGALLQRLGLQ